MEKPNLISLLQKVDLFRDLPDSVLNDLSALVTHHEFSKEELIIQKGDQGDSLYIIAGGNVRVHDNDLVVANLGEGSFFGEMSFLDTSPRSMSVSADTKALLYRISRDDFYRVFDQYPEVFRKIVSTLSQRLRNQNDRVISELKSRETELTRLVDERTYELVEKNDELEKTLTELKATQEQLVRQEKLASLGQLTAGIAHEIKNPLNFVNNFAKLSFELLDEIIEADSKEERVDTGSILRQNLEKIHEHGSRADGIVKGMLEHSRSGGEGNKQLTDINRLCDQVIEICLRDCEKKWPVFAFEVGKDYAPDLPRMAVMTVDFSKMLVNLLNNACYSVHEKFITGFEGYQPAIRITTDLKNLRLSIGIHDNGTGIPEEIRDSIFNPFFTTKPTGEGAGLGLSIATDIVMAHGGTIICESEIGKGSLFVISVPVH